MTLAAFLSIWFLHLLAAISPGPAVLVSARTGLTQGFVTGFWLSVGIGIGGVIWAATLLAGFLNETIWNTAGARLFSFDRTRTVYLGLKSLIDKCFGGALALLGLKIATV